jgi:hypothetical protein
MTKNRQGCRSLAYNIVWDHQRRSLAFHHPVGRLCRHCFMQQSTENFPKMKNNPNQPQYGPRTA